MCREDAKQTFVLLSELQNTSRKVSFLSRHAGSLVAVK